MVSAPVRGFDFAPDFAANTGHIARVKLLQHDAFLFEARAGDEEVFGVVERELRDGAPRRPGKFERLEHAATIAIGKLGAVDAVEPQHVEGAQRDGTR